MNRKEEPTPAPSQSKIGKPQGLKADDKEGGHSLEENLGDAHTTST